MLHPLTRTGLLELLAEILAGGRHLLAASGAVLGGVLVQALPVLIPVAPALGPLRFVGETHFVAVKMNFWLQVARLFRLAAASVSDELQPEGYKCRPSSHLKTIELSFNY